MEPPDTIPNSEVKRVSADDSCGATYRENTSSPEQYFETLYLQSQILISLINPLEIGDFLWGNYF